MVDEEMIQSSLFCSAERVKLHTCVWLSRVYCRYYGCKIAQQAVGVRHCRDRHTFDRKYVHFMFVVVRRGVECKTNNDSNIHSPRERQSTFACDLE